MSDSPRQTWEQIPEPDPAYRPQPEPYAPAEGTDSYSQFAISNPQSTKPFTVLSATELLARDIPPRIDILGDGIISLGQLTTVIGQGGAGKSRVVMQIALSQALGWSFAGFATSPKPLRHLLIGTENSIHRQQSDLRKMTAALDPPQRQRLGERLFFHVVDQIEDAFINLGSEDIRKKWILTLEKILPDIVYVDPFGEVNIGDINKDADVRHTLRELAKVCRRFNPDVAIVLVHHARTGRQNIAQAVGWDKANFALGSKALYSGARSQINIAPADPDDPTRIVLSCGKSNDAKPFDPLGLRLDDQTMLYHTDPAFDLNAWKDDVEGKQRGQSVSIQDVMDIVRDGKTRHKEIIESLNEAHGCARATAIRRVSEALEKGYLRKSSFGEYRLAKK